MMQQQWEPALSHTSASSGRGGKVADCRRTHCLLAVMQTGVVTRAQGSAYVEFGLTKVLVAV